MRFLLLLLALLPVAALADEPLRPPSVWQTCSPNGVFCARLDPEQNQVTAYRADAESVVLWTAPGWSRVAALSDDGEHLVLGYDGMNLIPVDYDPEMEMLTFHRRGTVIRRVPLSALVDRGVLQRTVSHWYWGDYLGLDAAGRYAVRTAAGQEIHFNLATGLPVR